MTTISELIARSITPEGKRFNEAMKDEVLSTGAHAKSDKPQDVYEAWVFDFLHKNKLRLGISRVVRFAAAVLDGALELSDGNLFVGIEIKYRMNWEKACGAEWQFRNYMRRHAESMGSLNGGIVIFEEFSGDWNRRQGDRILENGWSHWYRGHSQIYDDFHLSLLRLEMGGPASPDRELVGFHDAMKLAELARAVRTGIEEAEHGLATEFNEAALNRVKAAERQRRQRS